MSRRPLAGYCPLCGRYTAVWIDHTGRLAYVVHGPDVINGDQCEASCWIAEDDELVPLPPSQTTDVAAESQRRRRAARRTTRSTTA